MLIIKKFHDYYDSAIGFGGVDKTCVYDRKPLIQGNKYEMDRILKQFEKEDNRWNSGPYSYNYFRYSRCDVPKNYPYSMEPFVIGFCGKTYVGYCFKWDQPGQSDKIQISYDLNEILKIARFKEKKNKYSIYDRTKTDKDSVTQYFDKFHNKEHKDLFVKYHTPVFIIDYGTGLSSKYDFLPNDIKDDTFNEQFIINPRLADYEFYQVFNTAQTFQEIQMYLQGVLGNVEKPMVEISEKDKIVQHGMDKWSFRNPCPPARKLRRQKNAIKQCQN